MNKAICYKQENLHKAISFSAETLQTRKGQHDILKVLKTKQNKTKNKKNIATQKYSTQKNFPSDLKKKIKKSLQDMKKLKEFIISVK